MDSSCSDELSSQTLSSPQSSINSLGVSRANYSEIKGLLLYANILYKKKKKTFKL